MRPKNQTVTEMTELIGLSEDWTDLFKTVYIQRFSQRLDSYIRRLTMAASALWQRCEIHVVRHDSRTAAESMVN